MTDVPFQIQLSGGTAEYHEIPAYDGYMALAGLGLSLSLVSNYVETGKIRRRGDFVGRNAVRAKPIEEGSVVADFVVHLGTAAIVAGGLTDNAARRFLYDVFKRTIDRNLGLEHHPDTEELSELQRTRGGDLEALVAATEPSVRQAHSVIGEGAEIVTIMGGRNHIGRFDVATKTYVDSTMEDSTIRTKDVSVASFNANSGYGSVFDNDLGRTIPIKLTKETLDRAKTVLSWGLDQYARQTGSKISLTYFSLLSMDGTPKKYIVVDAEIPED